MSSELVQNIPWSIIQPDAKTMMNHYLSQYIDKVSFDFVYEVAWPVGCLAVITGAVTTIVLYSTSLKGQANRRWIIEALGAFTASMGLVAEYAAVKELGKRIYLTDQIKLGLQQLVVWKAISNNVALDQVESCIQKLFTQVAALNGPMIPDQALIGLGGFCTATVIYVLARKSANPNYSARMDTVFRILTGNLVLTILFKILIRKEVIIKTIISL